MNTMPLTHTCWTRESSTFPGHSEYMEILPGVGRMIVAAVILTVWPGLVTAFPEWVMAR